MGSSARIAAALLLAFASASPADIFDAVRNHKREEVQTYLAEGLDPNTRDSRGWTPLHVAAKEGYGSAIRLLLEGGADLEARDRLGRTPLHIAAAAGWDSAVESLLEHGSSTDAVDSRGRTPFDMVFANEGFGRGSGRAQLLAPMLVERGAAHTTLHAAVALGDTARVRELLEQEADPNARMENGRTPLHWVAWQYGVDEEYDCRPEEARLLLEAGADIEGRDAAGRTPLHWACAYRCADVARLLVERGADVNALNAEGETPLFFAMARPDLVALFLERGADPFLRSLEGATPLHNAWDGESVRLLIAAGVDVNARDNERRTPLHTAVRLGGNMEPLDLLLEHGADPDAATREGETPLARAAGSFELGYVKALRERGASVNVRGPRGWTPLHEAADGDDEEIVGYLLSEGADPNARDDDGRTPIFYGIRDPDGFATQTPPMLLEAGADVNVVDHGGLSLLEWTVDLAYRDLGITILRKGAECSIHAAAGLGDVAKVNQLIDRGADPNLPHPRYNRTPLHWAVRLGQENTARALIERGADVNARDDLGSTPLHWAVSYWHKGHPPKIEVMRLLLDNNAEINARDDRGETALALAERSIPLEALLTLLRERGGTK